MHRESFFKLMNFPPEWVELDLYPRELATIQLNCYKPGQEDASEHYRCGAFHWWLKQEPSEQKLKNLMLLASIDPDPLMGEDIRSYIRRAKNYTSQVETEWRR
jgi:hypothetical protein